MELQIRDGRTGNFFKCLIDEEDYDHVQIYAYNLYIQTDNNGYKYVYFILNSKPTLLHRFLLRVNANVIVDHENGDTLDNRRTNLRVATKSQNAANAKLTNRNTSGFKGVTFARGSWYATITVNYHKIVLGSSHDPEEAAKMYDVGAIKYFGPFARTNFPRDQLVGVSIRNDD